MNFLRAPRPARLDALLNLALVLATLLVALAIVALAGSALGLLGRFRQEILLFVIGAIIAYLMAPLARALQRVLRARSAAILASYLLLFVALLGMGYFLVNPFITQARSLQSQLRHPGIGELSSLKQVHADAGALQTELVRQQQILALGGSVPLLTSTKTTAQIGALQAEVNRLSSPDPSNGTIRLPSSVTAPISSAATRLGFAYGTAIQTDGISGSHALDGAVTAARTANSAAATAYTQVSSDSLLLLNLQSWLDQRGIKFDLHTRFGSALQQLNKQLANLLNNALTVATEAGTLLLDTVLALIISVYFLADGARFVRWMVALVPFRSRDEAEYFVSSLDRILGSYLRTQVLLALLAGAVSAAGAVILKVPYPVVIFFSSFLLSLIPVIGPVVLPLPPVLIALVFTSIPTAIAFFVWIEVGEQIITNILGPRMQGRSVGIHPLVAMAAALFGFPLAGFLGSFFAVPLVAFLNVVVRQYTSTRKAMKPPAGTSTAPDAATPTPAR